MRNTTRKTLVAALLGLVAAAPAIADDHAMAGEQDIVAIASANPDFETLVAALKAGDLVGTLQGAGPFTVFAPTDAAFDKLPAGALDDLLKPENKAKLQAVLKYHVVPGKVLAADVVKVKSAKSVEGTAIPVMVSGDKVTVDGANVVKTDIVASNGVIHVVDTVLMPE